MEYLKTKQVPKTMHEIMVSSCSLDKYIEVNQRLKKYKKSNRYDKFIEIYGNDNKYNLDDYKLFLESRRRRIENENFMKICLDILYKNKEKLFELTSNDYANIKKNIFDNYSCIHYDMKLIYYYEIINYVTKSYPGFLSRYIETYENYEEETNQLFLLCYRDDLNKMIIEEFNKSRVDTKAKSKILTINSKDNQKVYF